MCETFDTHMELHSLASECRNAGYIQTLDALERALISYALKLSAGNVAHASRLLGIQRTTLVMKIQRLFDSTPYRNRAS